MKHNKLIHEKSPYLRQHSHQPVDWYPWNDEAFEKARKENKPIFLSIGYSTCHWCHVMSRESFEDEEIAQQMNEIFVSIKVDREERPDIDKIYMKVSIMMTGSGGWPLTLFLTPEKKPFFAATYIPKETQFGRKGLKELLHQIKDTWSHHQSAILHQGNQILEALQHDIVIEDVKANTRGLNEKILDQAFREFSIRFDSERGGFGHSPKFPSPHNYFFLLRYWKRNENDQALNMVETSLQSMQAGGIFDHIGFGFHRYSTDAKWILPHFEKMLYDQALLAIAYLETFQATGKDLYRETTIKILEYVLRDMVSDEGAFYSAEDADSEGEEGKYYLWEMKELAEILNQDELSFVQQYFNIKPDGNMADIGIPGEVYGKNIFYKSVHEPFISELSNSQKRSWQDKWERIRKKLYKKRLGRVAPEKDTKILTDWNGLMIAALSMAGKALGVNHYITAAKKAVNFILNHLMDTHNHLYHRFHEGEAGINGYLDDYAFLIWALLELYEATFTSSYLEKALKLNQTLISEFEDEKSGGFYFTSKQNEYLLIRQKEIYDGAIPSGNSISLVNLVTLFHLSGQEYLFQKANKLIKAFSHIIEQNPSAYAYFLVGSLLVFGPSYDVIVVGDQQKKDTKMILEVLQKNFLPGKFVIFLSTDYDNQKIISPIAVDLPVQKINGKATVYICKDYTCFPPTTESQKMLQILNK